MMSLAAASQETRYFTITVVDEQTGRGVPLAELTTTTHLRYFTDSNGIIAFFEPALMGQRVFFYVKCHGYEFQDIVFDERAVVLNTTPGGSAKLKLKRLNIAERLYRITGQDIYGQSELVHRSVPIQHPRLNGKVAGQDTFIETVYKGKIYWFWGDTFGPADFNGFASGATSELPGKGGLDPSVGIDLTYFVDSTGFSKGMCNIPGPGLVWIDWLLTLKDEKGDDQLLAKYSRTKSLDQDYERGIAIFNDSTHLFERIVQINEWLGDVHSSGHPVRVMVDGVEYSYVIDRNGFERVRVDAKEIINPFRYEHFTGLVAGSKYDKASPKLDRGPSGKLLYGWKAHTDDLRPIRENELIGSGKMKSQEGLWQTRDIETGKPILIFPGSVFWNNFRKCWIMIGRVEIGDAWYMEGDTPTGPWVYGRKIVSHDRYDFYNVGQHPLFDQEGGRLIYFEGTYTLGFSGNKDATPLYDYNQMMYRLALDDPRLVLPAPVYRLREGNGFNYRMRSEVEAGSLWEKIEEVSFYAVPPDRKNEGMIAVYSVADHSDKSQILFTEKDQHLYKRNKKEILFYALPVEKGKDDKSTATIALLEYKDKSNRIFYSTDSTLANQGAILNRTVCRVWQNPSTMLALDYKAKPVPIIK